MCCMCLRIYVVPVLIIWLLMDKGPAPLEDLALLRFLGIRAMGSMTSCFSRETPGEEPMLEELCPGLPKHEPEERPGRPGPGDAGPGDGAPAPAVCDDPCECCYYTLGSKTQDGYYTCGWYKFTKRKIWWHERTWWHGRAAHGMIDRNLPHLGINKPGTPQCACCYYRLVGDDGKGPGWKLTWERGYREWKWESEGATHWKPLRHFDALEEDRLDVAAAGNVAPGSSAEGPWCSIAPDEVLALEDGEAIEPPGPPPGSPGPQHVSPPGPPPGSPPEPPGQEQLTLAQQNTLLEMMAAMVPGDPDDIE